MPERTAPVSVIIPAYRAAATIARALRSVAAQTLPPREAVVVDDGSADGTFEAAEACRGFMGATTLKVFRQPNRGAGAARNRAIVEATQPVLAFLDADDEWLPAKLERSLAHLDQGHVLVAHNGWIVDGEARLLNDCAARFRACADPFVGLYKRGFLDTCTVVARRDAIVAAGGFDETLPNAQDFEMWLAVLRPPGARFLVFDEALSLYHLVPGSIMSYTRRRLECCHTVACRYAGDMRGRPGGGLLAVLFREVAIHREAATAYIGAGRYAAIVSTTLRAPIRLIESLRALDRTVLPRSPLGRHDQVCSRSE